MQSQTSGASGQQRVRLGVRLIDEHPNEQVGRWRAFFDPEDRPPATPRRLQGQQHIRPTRRPVRAATSLQPFEGVPGLRHPSRGDGATRIHRKTQQRPNQPSTSRCGSSRIDGNTSAPRDRLRRRQRRDSPARGRISADTAALTPEGCPPRRRSGTAWYPSRRPRAGRCRGAACRAGLLRPRTARRRRTGRVARSVRP